MTVFTIVLWLQKHLFVVVQESTGCHNTRFPLYVQMSGWAKDITQVVKGCPRDAGLENSLLHLSPALQEA